MTQLSHYDTCTDPLCVRCDAYGDGYSRGKDKAFFEVQRWIPGQHSALCGCEPCLTVKLILVNVGAKLPDTKRSSSNAAPISVQMTI